MYYSGARCTTRWDLKTLTSVLSDVAVEVDGMPRHVSNVKLHCPSEVATGEDHSMNVANSECAQDEIIPAVRLARAHRAPAWHSDYLG